MVGRTPGASTEPGRHGGRVRRVCALAAALVLLLALCCGCGSAARDARAARATGASTWSTQSTQFLATYLAANGRVVRTDQDGDTVSEGQAYGMLLAVAERDRRRFELIWSWTRAHLQRPDHLLAYLWRNGRVVDRNAAPDADLDAATALLRAATAFHQPAYRLSGVSIADSVLARETVPASPGTVVTAGTWAVADPAVLNPSYLVAGQARWLAHATGNSSWNRVAQATAALDRGLAAATTLPPDWAALPVGGPAAMAHATGSPDGSTQAQYGLDAPRLIIRLATSCSATDRSLAGRFAARLGASGAVAERTLSGAPLVTWRHPVTDLALYAARTAAGDRSGAASALRAAVAQNAAYPTYYGKAWLALAPALFGPLTQSCR